MTLFDVYPLQPLKIVRGSGSWVWDDRGDRYLDLYGGHAVISIGHAHPHWRKSIAQQLDSLPFYSNFVHLPGQNELAEKLGEVSGLTDYRLFLVNSGAEANENALKLASFHNQKKKVLAFRKSYHGRTSLALAATDDWKILAPVNETPNVVFLPLNDENALEKAFQTNEFSAVIVEAVQGLGGIHEANLSFLKKIRELCDAHDTVFVADCVQAGYGRTGRFFALDHAGVRADIYATAKGMGNGFPIGGVLISPKFEAKHGMLGSTFGGNPLACAAALAVLEVIENEGLVQNAARVGDYLLHELKQFSDLENVRGRGLMIGFDVPESQPNLRKDLLLKHHVFTGVSGAKTIRLLPSLALSQTEADIFLEKMQLALAGKTAGKQFAFA